MARVKILNINRRTVTQAEIALPFETDDHVLAAWSYLINNPSILDFSYRPHSEGEDGDRALMEAQFTAALRREPVDVLPAETIRRILPKIYQAELAYDIRELVGVDAG